MRKKIIIILLLSFLFACKALKQSRNNKQIKDAYSYSFKITYFKKILLECFNKSNAILSVISIDQSGYGENILSLDGNNFIDSLAKLDNKIIIQDSINKIGRVAEGAQGKHIFDYAILKYESKWLDSLTKKRYKLFKKNHHDN
jgi:hypothetical protein